MDIRKEEILESLEHIGNHLERTMDIFDKDLWRILEEIQKIHFDVARNLESKPSRYKKYPVYEEEEEEDLCIKCGEHKQHLSNEFCERCMNGTTKNK